MLAGVVERTQDAVPVPQHDHRPGPDLQGDEPARPGHLALGAHAEPLARKDRRHVHLEQMRVGVEELRQAVATRAGGQPGQDVGRERRGVRHDSS